MSQLGQPNRFYRPDESGARNRSERLRLVVNPRAGAGAADRGTDALERAAERAFEQWDLVRTEGPGHASELARQAVEEGVDIVAAVGGDGTCHEVVRGLMSGQHPRSRKVAFTTIPRGTGCDLARSLELPGRLQAALWFAATGITLPTDLGLARWTEAGGEDREEVYINSSGFGANGEVVRAANASSKALGARGSYLVATLRTLRRFRRLRVQVRWGGGPEGTAGAAGEWEGELLGGFVLNGSYCGGGMCLSGPGAMHDGFLDVVLVPPLQASRDLLELRHLYSGEIERIAGARRLRVGWVEVRAERGSTHPVELDGELPAALPCRWEVLPRRLHVRGGWRQNPLVLGGDL